MKFAVIGDIHSNIDALEAVVENIKEKQVDFIISTGDLVGYLPFPNEVIDFIRKERILVVKGNHDQVIGEAQKVSKEALEEATQERVWAKASALYTNAIITDENRKYLQNLPEALEFTQDEKKIIIVHGSPRRINEYLYENSEEIHTLDAEGKYDLVICGHTHIPYHQSIGDRHYINVGSVGKPKHGNSDAAYVVVTVEAGKVLSETIHISYSLERLEQEILENPYIADELIELLKKGI